MHKLSNTPITLDCFETDDYESDIAVDYLNQDEYLTEEGKQQNFIAHWHMEDFVDRTIARLEELRQYYLKVKNKKYWKELIRWLPESWLQKRTVTMTYENLLAMCSKGQRRFHKLNEWSGQDDNTKMNFIEFARSLPYAQELIFIDELASSEL